MAGSRVSLTRSILPLAAGISLLLSATAVQAQEAFANVPVNRDEIVHVLNRITFGPRPGDVETVQKMGLRNFIEQQLHPESIDDSAVEQQLAGFDLLQMSPEQLTDLFLSERKKALAKQKTLAAANGQAQTMPPVTNPGEAANATQVDPPPMPMATPGDKLGKMLDQANQYRSVGPDRVMKVVDDRDVIRPHIWGSFRELLEASAKSPAMLYYLDNATNTVAHTVTSREQMVTQRVADQMMQNGNGALAPPVPEIGSKKGGINENYAREIMELHTLGVDGGYTQQDVQEVARCFTGWSIDRKTGEFAFHARQHDNGSKTVLGHLIPAGGGMQDGETVLDILCANPACAHHIALQMCQRFVSDDPPAALVNRVAGVFTQTNGDLRKVTEAILTSPEFLSPANYNNKIKSPLEFAVSAVRATGSSIIAQQPPPFDKLVPALEGSAILGRGQAADRIAKRPRQSLNWHIYELGEPLFACTPPTGYKEVSKFWVSPGALIERLNFAMALTQQQVNDIKFNPQTILAGIDVDKPEGVLNQCVALLLQNNITDTTRKVLEQTALPKPDESKTVNPAKLIALIIGSPEFQRK
jgi:uncharacterized protein (DUF1800 family)